MKQTDLKKLLKRVVELVMPDLRAYYRITRKAKIVKAYASNGKYYADVQPLRNDESVDPDEPVIPKVEIPVIWAGPDRGVICPPAEGSYCDLSYYDGDPNYPRISNFRWQGNGAPAIGTGGFIIQLDAANYIKIDPAKHIMTSIEGNLQNDVGADKIENIGNNWTIQVVGIATIQAPQINLIGNLAATGIGGAVGVTTEKSNRQHEGSYDLTGPMTIQGDVTINGKLQVNGNIDATGNIIDGGANTNHHSHP